MAPAAGSLRRFDLSRDDPERARAEAAAALDAGQLVVIPTETVYGLAAREDRPEAVERLRHFKADRTGPFSLAVPSLEAMAPRLAPLGPVARRIAARWWPGPVTQVLAARSGPPLGVRVPGHAWTRDLLGHVGVPLLLPSANATGRPAPVSPDQLEDAVLAETAVLVDDGKAALGAASSVVAPGSCFLRILREGVVSRADLRRHALGTLVVVCSGNTCRSPMAAALLEAALLEGQQHDPRLVVPSVRSAGAYSSPGRPASGHAVAAMQQRGLDITGHSTHPLAAADLLGADLVLCMTRAHVAAVHELLGLLPGEAPGATGPAGPRVELFDPQGNDVGDPFGGSLADYNACAADLARMAGMRAAAWLSTHPPPPSEERTP